METLIELTMGATERLLIFQQEGEIHRITNQIQERAGMLNDIVKHGLSPDEIKNITSSKFSIEQYVENELLIENKEYARMKKAGIQGVTATLSNLLRNLKESLLRWESLKGGDKFRGLTFENNTWKVDNEYLEREFEMKGLKIYVEGEQLKTFRKIEQLAELLKHFNVPWNHITASSVLSRIIQANGQEVIPRWQYFRD